MAQIILADRVGSGRKGGKNGQMQKYDGPPIDTGSWGDLPRTCRFITVNDPRNKGKGPGYWRAEIDYLCRSAKWPKGCYKGTAPGAETVYMTPEEVIDLAREMGMTAEEAGEEWQIINIMEVEAGADTQSAAQTGSPTSSGERLPKKPRPRTSSSKARTAAGTPDRSNAESRAGDSTRSTRAGTGSPATKSARGKRATGSPSPRKGRR